MSEGTLLQKPRNDASTDLMATSSSYVMHRHQQWNENSSGVATILRMDGTLVRTVPLGPGDSSAAPTLVDDAYLQFDNSDGARHGVTVRSVETGALLWQQAIPRGRTVHVDDEWMLYNVIGADTVHNTLHLLRPDGTDVVVDHDFPGEPTWVGGDSATAYVQVSGAPYAIDTATGTLDATVFDDEGTRLLAVTNTTLIGQRPVPDSASAYVFTSRDRATGTELDSAPFSPDYTLEGYLPYGDRVAVQTFPSTVRLLDFATGTVGPALFGQVQAATPVGDGSLVVDTVTTTPTGPSAALSRVVAGHDPARIADFAPLGETVASIGLSGSRVAASWDSSTLGVWTRPTTANGVWTSAFPAATPPQPNLDRSFTYGGDVVLSHAATQGKFLVSWPGGSREFSARWATLGRHGTYVIREGNVVAKSRTGEVVRTAAGTVTVDGSWMWPTTDATGKVTVSDLTGTLADRVVDLGSDCRETLPEAWGRWVMASCANGQMVFDTTGEIAPRTLPSRTSVLGNGFAMSVERVAAGPGYTIPRLQVTDLVTGEVRPYGPIAGQTFPEPGYDFVANDDGSAEMAYTDPTIQVRHVRLDWTVAAQDPPVPPDTAAPVMGRPTGSPTYLTRTPSSVSYSVGATDANNVASYELQTRTTPAAAARRGWVTVSSASSKGSVTTPALAAGTEGCVRARARDAAGNVSAWAAERCSTVPVNNTSLTFRGRALRVRSYVAVNGDYTRLSGKGATATSAKQSGRTIGVWVVRGRGLGALDVYAGARRIARVSCAATATRRVLVPVSVPKGFSGPVRLVNVSKAPTQIDAITILR